MDAPTFPPRLTRKIDLVVVHCSATPSGKWLGGMAPSQPRYTTAPRIIDGWHKARDFKRSADARSRFNWPLESIGYHYVIDIDGRLWTGRHLEEVGAHVVGFNTSSVGICMVGGAEREARYTTEQWEQLALLVRGLTSRLILPLNDHNVVGHRDLSPDRNHNGKVEPTEWLKTCPGFSVGDWIARDLVPAEEHVFKVPS